MSKPFYDEDMSRRQERVAATADMKAQRRFTLELKNLKPGEQVLEVGAGNGIYAREMLEIVGETGHVTGIDGSEAMVAMAGNLCPGGTFLQGDAMDLPVESGRFDVVTANQLLCFVPGVDKAVAEMFRVLKPGGRVVLLDSDWGSIVWNCRDENLLSRVLDVMITPYADAHVPRTLSRHLTTAGFKMTGRHTYPLVNWALEEGTYSQQILEHLGPMAADVEGFGPDDVAAWFEDQKSVAAAGDFMFSLNRYVFCATKP